MASILYYFVPTIIVHVPWLNANGMALFPFILVKQAKPSATLINHEKIHLIQQLEMLIVPFYIWYLVEYSWHLFRYKNNYYAYRKISFEQEAFAHDQDLTYLKHRPLGAWFRFCWQKK
jgi:hypothetical protein